MGCAASRLDNEDVVRRCRDRRRLMRDAVQSRHHLASAHADYLRGLRVAGAALTAFARGEPLAVSDRAPPVLLPSPSTASSTLPPLTPQPPPPPPPPRVFSPSPSPSPTIASSKMPHILSASSAASTPAYKPRAKSTYATTPSQASSSVWDWENFYPPSPPDSEYFDRLKREREEREELEAARHHLPVEEEEEEEEEEEGEREEVQCSEWGDRYGTSSSSTASRGADDDEDGEEMDMASRSERFPGSRSHYAGSSSESAETRSRTAPSEIGSMAAEKLGRRGEGSEAGSFSTVGGGGGMRMVVRHRDLAEIVVAIEEYFVHAATAGEPVSELLETGRAQLDRSFRQLKKTVYHSSGVLSALSSRWSSKPPLAIRYRLDTGALEESGAGRSHGSTLERLLAWEKKLYEEVKAREAVKIEHEKKLSSLQSQEYKGRKDEKLDKTKASITKLQSLIMVTSQAVSTTSSAIIKVRDNELAPQLVDMCYGIMNMWRSMNHFHEIQNHIVQQVRGLVNRANTGEATSDLHRVATRDLESAVSAWYSNFNRLVKHQRDYICALHGWLRLTLSPVSSDSIQKDHSSAVAIELAAFLDEWKQALDRLPDTVASEAIKSFVNVVHVISTKQVEELKIKKRAEAYSKELEKKSATLRSIERKFYHSYSMVGIGLPGDNGHDTNGQVFDTRDPLAEKKSEIAVCRRKVEDEMAKHMKAVEVTRSMTLNNIQTGLPGVFQAMTGFSGLFADALQGVCRRAATAG